MDDQSWVTDEVRARIGVPLPPRLVTITPDLVLRVRETLAGHADVSGDGVPPMTLLALDGERAQFQPSHLAGSGLLTGNEWEWRRPLRLGDTLTVSSRLIDARERMGGRLGHSLLLYFEALLTQPDGELVAAIRHSIAHYAAARSQPPEPPPPAELMGEPVAEGVPPTRAAEGDPLDSRLVTPTLGQVIRYCATAWSFTPIFYDPDAARGAGLPGTIVPGPLKTALLAEMVLAWAGPRATLEMIRTAYRRPDLPGRPMRLGGVVTSVEAAAAGRRIACEVWSEDVFGMRTVTGAATVRVAP